MYQSKDSCLIYEALYKSEQCFTFKCDIRLVLNAIYKHVAHAIHTLAAFYNHAKHELWPLKIINQPAAH